MTVTLIEREGRTRLKLPAGIIIPVVWSRPLPGRPRSVRVYQDTTGHWYASFVVETPTKQAAVTRRAIGVDWGVKETATTVGMDIPSGATDESASYDLPYQGVGREPESHPHHHFPSLVHLYLSVRLD